MMVLKYCQVVSVRVSIAPLRPQFLVKRKGLGCNEYGVVEGRAAKQQRLHPLPAPAGEDSTAADETAAAAGDGAEAPAACPVSLLMVEEYEVGTVTATSPPPPR